MLRARLFGPLAVEIDDRLMPAIPGARPRSVLAWLLLHPGLHSRARLAALFWPDVLDTCARASLRNAVWTIRSALAEVGGSDHLEASRDQVGIAGRLPVQVDTEQFDRLVERDDPEALERALVLAQAPLLVDLADDWVLAARDAQRERIADVALRLAEAREQAGDPRAAAGWTRRALRHVPLRESAHRALMRRLSAAGERAEALAAYDRCVAVLGAELGVVPSETTRALAARLRAQRRDPTPTPVAVPATPPARAVAPLVGRARELRTAHQAWQRARDGHGGVLLINGAAGLGKSRLVAELAGRVAADGARCVVGTAYELAGAPPCGPWVEALDELVATTPAPPGDAGWAADLARLCRSVQWRWGRHAASPPLDPEQERGWLFEAVVEALAWCARPAPLLLVLEDVHLADRASIALLTHAGRRLIDLPVLLVATRRPATSRPDLAIALDALARRKALAAEIVLAPLTRPELATIVRACAPALPADEQERVVRAAAGNPLLAREAARAAASGGDAAQGLRAWIRAPLARLPASARLLVDVVAAAGRPVDPGEAAELVGAAQLSGALHAACREELLDGGERRIRFSHPLLRQACYAELEPARRTWLHGRLADVLDARPSRAVAEIARHLVLGSRAEEARGYLVAAAQRAIGLGALDEAVGSLREAAELASDSPTAAGELWLAIAEVQAWRGSRNDHDAAFDRAVALIEASGDQAAVVAAHTVRGRCLRTTLCFPRDALAAYQHALQLIDSGLLHVPELRALALAGSAWVHAASGDVDHALQLVAETAALPEVAQDVLLAAELEAARAAALLRRGSVGDSGQAYRRAAALANQAGRPDLEAAMLLGAAAVCACCGDAAAALALADQVRGLARGGQQTIDALAARGYALARLGRAEQAWQAVAEELSCAERVGYGEPEARFDAGSIALQVGKPHGAVEQLAAALDATDGRVPRVLARLRLAEARLLSGDPTGARRELDRLPFEPVAPSDRPETLVPRVERLEGLIAAALGEPEHARELLASAEDGWRRLLGASSFGEGYAANIVDLGRAPVAGLIDPGLELARVQAERAQLLADQVSVEERAEERAG